MACFDPSYHVQLSPLIYDWEQFGHTLCNPRSRCRVCSVVRLLFRDTVFGHLVGRPAFVIPLTVTPRMMMMGRPSSCMRTMRPACRRLAFITVASMHSHLVTSRTSWYGSMWWSGALRPELCLLRHLSRKPRRAPPWLAEIVICDRPGYAVAQHYLDHFSLQETSLGKYEEMLSHWKQLEETYRCQTSSLCCASEALVLHNTRQS